LRRERARDCGGLAVMALTRGRKPPIGLRSVNLLWYPVALIPILMLLGAALAGWLPLIALPFALFFLFFWMFSLGFALYAKSRKPKEPRQ
jgi:hypothetical protein